MNPVSGCILLLLLVVVCAAPRRWALLAIMGGVFFLTQGQSINIGLNLYPIRFLEAAAFARVIARRELIWSRLNRIDWTLLLLYNYVAVVWILRSPNVAPQQFASALDPTLCYVACRALIRGLEDVEWLLYAMVPLLVPYTALVFLERLTGQSSFAIVGGSWSLYSRNGIPRCEGSFRHATLLGSVAASFLPLYIALWRGGRRRPAAALGGILCVSLIILSNSGGPIASTMAALGGWLAWRVRTKMRLLRRGAVAVLVLLIIFMKAPIWYLPFKISSIVGGGGYHRGRLMEAAWTDLHKWYFAGMDITQTAGWFPYELDPAAGMDSADITNQFIVFGLKAGLVGVGLAITTFVFAFKGLGSAMALARRHKSLRQSEFLLWGLGVALFVHVVSWLGVSYFDQSWVIWLAHVAAVSASVQSYKIRERQRSLEPAHNSLDEDERISFADAYAT